MENKIVKKINIKGISYKCFKELPPDIKCPDCGTIMIPVKKQISSLLKENPHLKAS